MEGKPCYFYRCPHCGLQKVLDKEDFLGMLGPVTLMALAKALATGAVGATHVFHRKTGCPNCRPDGPWKFITVAVRVAANVGAN